MDHRFWKALDALHQTNLLRRDGHSFMVKVDGKELEVTIAHLGEHRFLLRLPDRSVAVDWARKDREVFLQLEGETFHFREEDAAHTLSDDHGEESDPSMNSPLPGRVVKVLVKPGDEVKKGQPVVVIDSMKIEFEFKATRSGTVDKVLAVEGKQIDVGESLLVLK